MNPALPEGEQGSSPGGSSERRSMRVRNWWLEGGHTLPKGFSSGPPLADDGFTLFVWQRDKGKSTLVGRLVGRIEGEELSLRFEKEGEEIEVTELVRTTR